MRNIEKKSRFFILLAFLSVKNLKERKERMETVIRKRTKEEIEKTT